jgi:hypothetical protein
MRWEHRGDYWRWNGVACYRIRPAKKGTGFKLMRYVRSNPGKHQYFPVQPTLEAAMALAETVETLRGDTPWP